MIQSEFELLARKDFVEFVNQGNKVKLDNKAPNESKIEQDDCKQKTTELLEKTSTMK